MHQAYFIFGMTAFFLRERERERERERRRERRELLFSIYSYIYIFLFPASCMYFSYFRPLRESGVALLGSTGKLPPKVTGNDIIFLFTVLQTILRSINLLNLL